MSLSRQLAVAHQQPGECAYCDDRYRQIQDAFMREAAAAIRSEGDHASYEYTGGWEWAADLLDPDEES